MKLILLTLLMLSFYSFAAAQDRYRNFVFGVDYYPEQWPEERWESDARRMVECGVNTVRIGEFGWALMEPREGVFDFSLFDRAIAVLAKHKISVIFGTPTAAPPKWLTSRYPEVLYAFDDGRKADAQSRRYYSRTSPIFRRFAFRIVSRLAQHYADNKSIVGWQIDNEFNNEDPEAWSNSDRIAFREWLKGHYGSLAELNRRWGTVFWSQTYSSWSQIDLPFKTPALHHPAMMLDYHRFISDSARSFMEGQIEVIRRYRPGDWITQNGVFRNIDYYKMSQKADLHASASYPLFSSSPQYSTGASLTLHRSIKGRFMIMEQQTGAGGQTYLLRTPRPGEMRLWTMQSIAHGADGIVHFRWRSALKGIEQYWQGVLDQDDVPRERYRDFQQEGREIARLAPEIFGSRVRSEIAVLKDYENEWAYEHQFMTSEVHPNWVYGDFFKAASELKYNIDFVSSSADFSGYRLVFAPYQLMVDKELVARFAKFVENGGTLVLSAHSGVKDRDNAFTPETLPIFGLRELFGMESDGFNVYQPPARGANSLRFESGIEIPANVFAEKLHPLSGRVVATWGKDYLKGLPAVIENRKGSGKAVYYGSFFNYESAAYLVKTLGEELGLKPILTGIPKEVEVTRRSKGEYDYYFILNHREEPVEIKPGAGFLDLLSGRDSPPVLALEGFGYRVLRKRR